MQLIIDDDDVSVLRDMLGDQLHELRFEVARTEAREFRHTLVLRQEVLERLLAKLKRAA